MRASKGLGEIKHRNKKGALGVFHPRFSAQAWACTLTAGSAARFPVLDVD